MVYQCGIIFGFLAIGELIVWLTGIKLPSSIIGMLLLTACLQLKWIRLRWVEGIANFLVKNHAVRVENADGSMARIVSVK